MRFLLLALALSSPLVSAAGLTRAQREADFTQLKAIIESQYGPFQFKHETGVIDFTKLNAEFDARVDAARTNQEFYSAITEYIARFRDGHFTVSNPNARVARLPLNLDLIEGKVLISFIDLAKLPQDKFAFAVGDEVLSVDGQPVNEVVASLSRYVPSGNPATVKRKAVWAILQRSGALFAIPDGDTVTLVIRHGATGASEQVSLPWTKTGSLLDENEKTENGFLASTGIRDEFIARDPSVGFFFDPRADKRYHCNADTRIKLPEGAEIVMKKPIMAYTYPTAKGRVGYIRIQDYYPLDASGELTDASVNAWFEKLRFVVRAMESSTVGLVIDQDSNCGGSVDLVERVVSLFAQKPEMPQQFRFRISKAQLLKREKELTTIPEDTLDYVFTQKYVNLLKDGFANARGSMTAMSTITNKTAIFPDREANYTHPLVVLIDEIAGSGGDAFPSMIKGIGRAKLFGQQTSGLGGSVEEITGLTNSQLAVRMTVSQFFKPDLTPVENNGAVPDAFYVETRDDVMQEYVPYQRAYTNYLLQQIP